MQMPRHSLCYYLIAGVLGLAAGASNVDAASWKIIPATSFIHFSATQMGHPFQGEFGRFDGRIDFDAGSMPKGDVKIEVDLASIKTGVADRDSQALGDDWFAIGKHPKAVFSAQQFKRVDANSYKADGELTIRGKSVPLTLPFTLQIDSDGLAEMHGKLSLGRLGFGLGASQLSDKAIVGHDIAVEITVHARRAD